MKQASATQPDYCGYFCDGIVAYTDNSYIMTNLLEKAISEISKLPEEDQDKYARLLFATLESDKKVRATFGPTIDKLGALFEKAKKAYHEGKNDPA